MSKVRLNRFMHKHNCTVSYTLLNKADASDIHYATNF